METIEILKSEATKACSSPSPLQQRPKDCSNLKPPMHGRCRDGAKIQRKANRHIFGYLSGFAVLFPFPETRTIKASSCRQAGRGDRAKQKPSLTLTVPVCCSVISHHTQHSASAERQTPCMRACSKFKDRAQANKLERGASFAKTTWPYSLILLIDLL